jgi:hypothetical protein
MGVNIRYEAGLKGKNNYEINQISSLKDVFFFVVKHQYLSNDILRGGISSGRIQITNSTHE